ncbi:MAG TPA: DUF971 domain-containing protein [Gemmatimonadales bacterium]
MTAAPIPQRIHRGDDALTITWEEGHEGVFPARALRVACPCAGCRDEMTGRVLLDVASVAADVRALSVRLVGSYAIQIDWSDGHGTGIYTYEFLRAHCPCERCDPDGDT